MPPPSESSTPPTGRLNLLAFPSETDAAFALFMASAILMATLLGRVFLVVFIPESTTALHNLDIVSAVRGEAPMETLKAFAPYLITSVLLAGAILGVAFLIYRRHPGRLRQRKRLQPASEKDAPLQQMVNELATRTGVSPVPTVEISPGLQGGSGQAFGLRDAYVVQLDGGLRAWQRIKTKQKFFRAVVLHELAHIANDDVWRSYFAEAVWTAMIVISIPPLVLGFFTIFVRELFAGLQSGEIINHIETAFNALSGLVSLLLQIGLTMAVIAAIRAWLLRTREMYADWRAAVWGAHDALQEMFQNSAEAEESPSRFGVWRLHPTAAERAAALHQPNQLFRLARVLPFIVGFLLGIVLASLFAFGPPILLSVLMPINALRRELANMQGANPSLVTGLLYWASRVLFFAVLVGFFAPIAWLLSGVLGAQVQKQSLMHLVQGRRATGYVELGVPAILLALGMEIGFWVVPFSPMAPDGSAEIMVSLAFLVLTAVLSYWFLVSARYLSTRVLARHTGSTRPTRQMRLVFWALNGWLLFFFVPLLVLGLVVRFFLAEGLTSFLLPILIVWLVGAIIFGALFSWAIAKGLSALLPARCPECGQVARSVYPVAELCAYCSHTLGEWLFTAEG